MKKPLAERGWRLHSSARSCPCWRTRQLQKTERYQRCVLTFPNQGVRMQRKSDWLRYHTPCGVAATAARHSPSPLLPFSLPPQDRLTQAAERLKAERQRSLDFELRAERAEASADESLAERRRVQAEIMGLEKEKTKLKVSTRQVLSPVGKSFHAVAPGGSG